ncbi:hypothetical protein KGF57_000123 [Candida theae]|uniref:RING-type domain-containing protein n=1 Tax=Candida theae TaxID=1198502 RepID=A0AAD5G0V9_9ASCO|nr:uncharacterized protein KGF57_000123 [Candida theae]KAI5968429.1 hypothetical protein KGF57_000123 [Candida theae]
MSSNVITIDSDTDSDDDDDDVEILEFRKITQDLLDNPQSQEASNEIDGNEASASATKPDHKTVKRLGDIQCPICFDNIDVATVTSCGHVFCLECIEASISSSHARGQGRMPRGRGLCPMCRKVVSFKETIVLKLKKSTRKFVEAK